jgi:excisionase family DNA binding protein
MDIAGVAGHLGVSVRHIRKLVAQRRIPYVKWGNLLRFDPNAIASWLDEKAVSPQIHGSRNGRAGRTDHVRSRT